MVSSRRRGFTITELIVVIVIIAVLAVIGFVSYSGLKTSAYNTKVVAGVKQYQEAIELYKTRNKEYPRTAAEIANPNAPVALTCLGTGYKNGKCGKITGVTVREDAAFNTAMQGVVDDPPVLGEEAIQVADESFVGAVYGVDAISSPKFPGATRGRTIQWALAGHDVDCGIAGAYSYNRSTSPPTTACEIALEPLN